MKRIHHIKMIFIFSGILLTLGGCPLLTRSEVEGDDQERATQKQISTVQSDKAEQKAKVDDLEGDLRSLSGRLEALEYGQKGDRQGHGKEVQELKTQVTMLENRLKGLEQHVDATEARLIVAIQALGDAAPSNSGSKAADSDKGSDGDLFQEAEGFFEEKDFKRAIVKYQLFRDKHPKNKQAPEATYKIGLCFLELKQKKTASEFFKEAVEKYPGSQSAKKAQQRLKSLK